MQIDCIWRQEFRKIWNEGRQRENYRPLYRYRTPTDLFRFAFVLQCTMHEVQTIQSGDCVVNALHYCNSFNFQFLFGFQHRNAPAGLDRKSVVLFMQPSVYLITFIYSKKWRWCFCGSTVDPELLGKVSNWINNMHAVLVKLNAFFGDDLHVCLTHSNASAFIQQMGIIVIGNHEQNGFETSSTSMFASLLRS